jgi:hypothetical protein
LAPAEYIPKIPHLYRIHPTERSVIGSVDPEKGH